MLTYKQRITCKRIHECSRTSCLNLLHHAHALDCCILKIHFQRMFNISCTIFTNKNLWVFFANDLLLFIRPFFPWRVTTDNIKAISQPEHLQELQHWVEEMIALGQLLDNIKATLTISPLQLQFVGLLVTHFCQVILQTLNLRCTLFLLCIKVDSSLFRQEQIFLSSFACIRETNFRRSLFHVHIQDTLNIIPIILSCRKVCKVFVLPEEKSTPIVHHRL